MKKVLILGASGLVGRALIEEFKDRYDLYGTYASTLTKLPHDKQFHLEVHQTKELRDILRSVKPDIVISCLRGEFGQQLTFHRELAEELRNTSSRVYFFSTTNVFDGDFSKPHTETDVPIADSDYGKFKIDCEIMLTEILKERVNIIRIPAIWGKDSPRWKMILDSIKNTTVIDVYSNLICNNLLDFHLARQLRFIIENKLKGIFHLGSVDTMTQSKFYEVVLTKLGSELDLLKSNYYLDNDKTYYFTLQSTRDDLPGSLQTTNNEIISYLLG
ncbi:sugar nucleotide-binding protein [Neobacillus niacini]|uniref:sugar nucleotide-binding protein n=1 Tax=Neobacillus niacini TaxID=86668 RepID=UPI00203AA193|nr:sugar nucleotide-binding protein [Neobacillus niacini]MCM3694738.1 sugar nucleotide-binding protein [Neobacillus niacini]